MDFNLTAKQTEAYLHLTDNKDKAICFGGGKGGGKSVLFCIWAWTWSLRLAEMFKVKVSKHPPSLGFIGRKRAVDFNETTLETWKAIIPERDYYIRAQDKDIILLKGGKAFVKIDYGGLDNTDTINKFNSAEYAFIGIDQAEETQKKDISVLQASLRLKIKNGIPAYKELYTANPAECWLKDDFINGGRKNGIFIPALPDDNPYLPINYKETLRSAFEYDPSLLRAYLEGDWDAFSNLDDAMFKAIDFEMCRNAEIYEDSYSPMVLSADVATKHGDCETVILIRQGSTILDIIPLKGLGTTQISKFIREYYNKYNCDVVVVDSDGFGEGVADVLSSQNIPVTEFHGGYRAKAIDGARYRNLRTQFYDIVSRKLNKGLISLSKLSVDKYKELKRQACLIKLKAPDGMARQQVETKEDMRGRGVKSPDYVDALVYGEYGYWVSQYADMKGHSWR